MGDAAAQNIHVCTSVYKWRRESLGVGDAAAQNIHVCTSVYKWRRESLGVVHTAQKKEVFHKGLLE